MKTAEEWANDIHRLNAGKIFEEEMVGFIKQIQLDAWKQGMGDAADIITQLKYNVRSLHWIVWL